MNATDPVIRVRVDSAFAMFARIPGTLGNVQNPVGLIVASGAIDERRRAALWYVIQREGTPLGDVLYDEGETEVSALVPAHESSMATVYELARTPGTRLTVSRAVSLCGLEAWPLSAAGDDERPTAESMLRSSPWPLSR